MSKVRTTSIIAQVTDSVDGESCKAYVAIYGPDDKREYYEVQLLSPAGQVYSKKFPTLRGASQVFYTAIAGATESMAGIEIPTAMEDVAPTEEVEAEVNDALNEIMAKVAEA